MGFLSEVGIAPGGIVHAFSGNASVQVFSGQPPPFVHAFSGLREHCPRVQRVIRTFVLAFRGFLRLSTTDHRPYYAVAHW